MTACMSGVTGLTTSQDGWKSTVDLRRPARMKEFFDAVFGCRWMSLILTRTQSPFGEISSQARGVAPPHNDTSILSKCTVLCIVEDELAELVRGDGGRENG